MTPDFVAKTLHLQAPVGTKAAISFTSVTTDSRSISPGCLFVALKGDKVDGNDFIEGAIAQGATGIICRKNVEIPKAIGVHFFQVEDTLIAFRKLAAAWRREFSIPMIVVAGSAGKTTTKELLAAILQGKYSQVLKTEKSQNGYIGIPITLLNLRSDHQAAVIEVGIDEIGAMQEHMRLVSPTVAVLTAIGPEHLEKLIDVPSVAREEGIALSSVSKSGGMMAINLDDPWIRPHATTLREGKRLPFSLDGNKVDMDMLEGTLHNSKPLLTVKGLGLPETQFKLPLLGKHNASNLLAAITVAAGLGLNGEEIQNGLKHFKGAEGRSEIHQLGNSTFLCDYYNAQPASVVAGLELLTDLAKKSGSNSRWVCLGDMLELGTHEEQYHRQLATTLIEKKIENVLLLGSRMSWLYDELNQKNFSGHCAHFSSHEELTQALRKRLKEKSFVLIKGSRSMKMEEVWKTLMLAAANEQSKG